VVQEVPSPEDWVDRLFLAFFPGAIAYGFFHLYKFLMATKELARRWLEGFFTPLVYYFLY
jgi:hypothetical protein